MGVIASPDRLHAAVPDTADFAPTRSLADTLAAIDSCLPTELVDGPMRAALHRVTARVPAALTRRVYLECRLHTGAPQVDVVFCVDQNSREHLAYGIQGWLPPALRAHALWTGLVRLCSRWATSGSAAHRLIYDVWLEFDVGERSRGDEALVPGVFVGFGTNALSSRDESWAAAQEFLELLLGRSLAPRNAHAAARCVRRLPPEAGLAYIGCMYPRDAEAIRLCVAPMDISRLSGYLRECSWPGPVDWPALTALDVLAGTARSPVTTLLHLDVRERALPRIGIEIPLVQRPQFRSELTERRLLDRLCALHLCAPAKRDALLRWPGYAVHTWPDDGQPSAVVRRVSHVKLVFEPGAPALAKAYLSVFHGFPRHITAGR